MKATTSLATLVLLSACGSYEPPKPGKHRAPGDTSADVSCEYETPTASRFMSMRCRSAENSKQEREISRETADSIRTSVPEVK